MSTSSSSQIIKSSTAEYQDGLAFRFALPKGTNLSLRAVDCKDGVPKLRFSTSQKVPSITEEDVAVCVKLAEDKRRPEFFYTRFRAGHPFYAMGRNYMHHSPAYLKRTSVGELFAEADWKMKGLYVGVMSDDKKQSFRSWPELSKLDKLETCESFEQTKEEAQVLMTCESVDIEEEEEQLIFVGEPNMKITDTGSPSYTDYITENFDRIAYYDEPTFLKMKEIVKLMLGIEWLRDKGVKFSKEWVQTHSVKPTTTPQQPVQVTLSNEQKSEILGQMQEAINSAMEEVPQISSLPSSDLDVCHPQVSLKEADVNSFDSGIEFKVKITRAEPIFEALTGLNVPLVTEVKCRVTLDDFDFLYEGIDPNAPVTKYENGDYIKPQVGSFAELFAETMPFPCVKIDMKNEQTILTGGCTTTSIPVQKTVLSSAPVETATVRASSVRKQKKIVCTPSKQQAMPPTKVASTVESTALRQKDAKKTYGWTDKTSSSLSTSDGQVAEQFSSLHGMFMITQLIGGKEVGPPIRYGMHLRLPKVQETTQAIDCAPCKDSPHCKDSAYSSMHSLVAN